MLRISGGELKNKQIEVADLVTRPLTERIRISMFDLIKDFISNAKVLDLYAGSGITGLEALSRGSDFAYFVDNDRFAIKAIKKNIANCGVEKKSEIIMMNAKEFILKTKEKFDLVFLDPPFDQIKKFDMNLMRDILNKDGLIVARFPSEDKKYLITIKHSKFEEVYSKKFGSSIVIFYKAKM